MLAARFLPIRWKNGPGVPPVPPPGQAVEIIECPTVSHTPSHRVSPSGKFLKSLNVRPCRTHPLDTSYLNPRCGPMAGRPRDDLATVM
jgi:hypothetical protein